MHLRSISPKTAERFAGGIMQQTWSALYWFEKLFQEKPISAVFEVGTGHGSLSSYFGLQCPGSVLTINDWDARSEHTKELHLRLGVLFQQADALKQETVERIMKNQAHPAFIFCDDGDKEREFELYAPHLQPGDVIGVHDNGTEFHADRPRAQAVVDACGLVRWRKDELDSDKTLLAIWIKP